MMNEHELTSADEWFLKKGQIDSISRSRFSVGDKVVVCDHRHVMLAEFYNGECPTCHSTTLLPFRRENVEPGTLRSVNGPCPLCGRPGMIIYSQHGMFAPYAGRCPKCLGNIRVPWNYFENQQKIQRASVFLGKVNKVLRFLLVALVVALIALNWLEVISIQSLVQYAGEVIAPKNSYLIEQLQVPLEQLLESSGQLREPLGQLWKTLLMFGNEIYTDVCDFLHYIVAGTGNILS